MSARSRGEKPNAVALRRYTGVKSSSARRCRSSSTRTFDSAYGVTGRSGASSLTRSSPPDAPYTEHVDAYLLTGALPDAWLFALGALFILVTLFMPKGIVGILGQLRAALTKRETKAPPPPAAPDGSSGSSARCWTSSSPPTSCPPSTTP